MVRMRADATVGRHFDIGCNVSQQYGCGGGEFDLEL
jgi:hypothetical protein